MTEPTWGQALRGAWRAAWKPALALLGLALVTLLLAWGGPRGDISTYTSWPERLSPSLPGQLLVTALEDHKAPLEGAQVSLYRLPPTQERRSHHQRLELAAALLGGGQEPSGRATTDARGQAVVPLPAVQDEPGAPISLLLVVEHGGQRQVLWRDYTAPARAELALLTDRPLYQPGQLIQARLLAVDPDQGAPLAGPVQWELRDPRGNLLYQKEGQASAAGVASIGLPLAAQGQQGDYRLRATFGGQTREELIQVQTYRLPRFQVQVQPQNQQLAPGQTLRAVIDAQTTYGDPIKEGSFSVVLRWERQGGGGLEKGWEGKLDAQGRYELTWEAPRDLAPGRPVRLEASVTSDTGRTQRGQASVPVAPEGFSLQLLSAGAEGWIAGLPNTALVEVKEADGGPAGGVSLALTVQEQHSERTQEATTDAQGHATFTWTPRYGSQRLKLVATRDGATPRRLDLSAHATSRGALFELAAPTTTVGQPIALSLRHLKTPATVVAFRRGLPIDTFTVDAQGQASWTPPAQARGAVTLRAFSHKGQELATAALWVHQRGGQEVQIQHPRPWYEPGQSAQVELRFPAVEGDAGPITFGLVGVDEALFALKERTGLSLPLLLREPGRDLEALGEALEQVQGAEQGDALSQRVAAARFAQRLGASPDYYHNAGSDLTRELKRQALRPWLQGWTLLLLGLLLAVSLQAARVTWRGWARQDFSWGRLGMQAVVALAASLVLGLMASVSPDYAMGGLTVWGALVACWLAGAAARGVPQGLGSWLGLLLAQAAVASTLGILASVDLRPDLWLQIALGVALGLPSLLLLAEVLLWSLALQRQQQRRAGLGLATLLSAVVLALVLPLMMTMGDMSPSKMALEEAPERFAQVALSDDAPMPSKPKMDDMDGEAPEEPGGAGVPRLRSWFPETMVWLPEITADAQGQAQVNLELPDSITTWRLEATANSQGGRLGQGQAPLKVWQPFFVEVELPTHITQGDRLLIPVALVNRGEQPQDAALEVSGEGGLEVLRAPTQVALGAQQRQVVQIEVRARAAGPGGLKVQARGQERGDAVLRSTTIAPDGRRVSQARSGLLGQGWSAHLEIPQEAIPGSEGLDLMLLPGLLANATEGLDAMLRQPQGCFEQTSSANYPNLMVLRLLQNTAPEQWPGGAQAWDKAHRRSQELVSLGYQRILSFQDGGGGFRLYPRPEHKPRVMLTAYGLLQLAELKKIHPTVDEAVMSRAAGWLVRQQNRDGTWPVYSSGVSGGASRGDHDPAQLRSTAFVVWALLQAPRPQQYQSALDKALAHLVLQAPESGAPDTLALIAHALLAAGRQSDAEAVLSRLAGMVRRQEDLAWWPSSGPTWMGGLGRYADIENTAMVASALQRGQAHGELVPLALRFLAQARSRHGGWGTTQATVWALRALEAAQGSGAGPVTLEITLDGQPMRPDDQALLQGAQPGRVVLAPKDQALRRFEAHQRLRGPHSLKVEASARSGATAQLTARYAVPWSSPRARVEGERVQMEIQAKERQVERGAVVELTAVVSNPTQDALGATMVELPLPVGGYLLPEEPDAWLEAGVVDRYEVTPTHLRLYLASLRPGQRQVFTWRAVALVAGDSSLPAGRAWAFYTPDPITEVDAGDLRVAPKEPSRP